MRETGTTRHSCERILQQCRQSLIACGASDAHAESVARATLAAEAEGNHVVGLAHLVDYLAALRAGRIKGDAVPRLDPVTPILTRIDAGGGMQHLGVDRALETLVPAAREFGLAAVASHNGFTIGALSYFPRRLAQQGLCALAFANAAPAVMPASGGKTPRFCTNPMAFAMPIDGAEAVVIDQSSTATALVAIRQAADRGERIPEGWALGPDGEPTTDPLAALSGLLLPFGGARGANIALMVELLAAGLSGADWSFDSAPFNAGDQPPSLGYFLLAIDPGKTAGSGWRERTRRWVDMLERDGAFVPGIGKGRRARLAVEQGIEVDPDVWEAVVRYGDPADAARADPGFDAD